MFHSPMFLIGIPIRAWLRSFITINQERIPAELNDLTGVFYTR
jgi:hypothetical protein